MAAALTPLLHLEDGTIAIGGHRGMGENLWSTSPRHNNRRGDATDAMQRAVSGEVQPPFRENTMRGFMEAQKRGVDFVEFDVQVTKDGVPIIWHDDDIITAPRTAPDLSETNQLHCTVKDLTLAQLQDLVHRSATAPSAAWETDLVRSFRSAETHTRVLGHHRWACRDDDGVPTLRQLFDGLPKELGFDLEVKMTSGNDVMFTPPEEVERMVTAILQEVEHAYGPEQPSSPESDSVGDSTPMRHSRFSQPNSRALVFSSFDPDVCTELSKRQRRFPVYFLSTCGMDVHVDPRRSSVGAALQFAASSALAGVVVPAAVVMAHESMVAEARARGLSVLTYGLENNDVKYVKRQQELGVRAAIVDDVAKTMPALGRICE